MKKEQEIDNDSKDISTTPKNSPQQQSLVKGNNQKKITNTNPNP